MYLYKSHVLNYPYLKKLYTLYSEINKAKASSTNSTKNQSLSQDNTDCVIFQKKCHFCTSDNEIMYSLIPEYHNSFS